MDVLALLIALIALAVAGAAYIRAGGREEMRKQLEELGVKTETARGKTADLLSRLEQKVRGKEKGPESEGGVPEGGAPEGGAPEGGPEGRRKRGSR